MKKIIEFCEIKSGKLQIDRSKLLQSIAIMGDCKVKLIIEKLYKKRSNNQNAYYWGVVIEAFCIGYFEMTGEMIEKKDAHDTLKEKFSFKEIVNVNTGEITKIIISTAEGDTMEFERYLEKCRDFILEWFNLVVPLPNE
jgi:hypothetical protein